MFEWMILKCNSVLNLAVIYVDGGPDLYDAGVGYPDIRDLVTPRN